MKKLSITAITLSLALTSLFASTASANNVAQSLCEYVAADDKKRFRSFLKSNKLKIRTIFDSVQCNGQNLLSFAASNNAVKTGAMIIYKLPKKTVSANLSDIESVEPSLFDIANTRIGD